MLLKVFSIQDVKADAFMNLFTAPANGVATRMFSDLAVDKNTDVGKHPQDYRLVHVGTFDTSTGVLLSTGEGPQSLGFASEFIPGKE